MSKIRFSKCKALAIALVILSASTPIASFASGMDNSQKYYMGDAVNAGKDSGYSESNTIKENDPHFGWKLGNFFVSGFTSTTKDEAGTPIILKTTGDKVTLWFSLEQDIDMLNGDDSLSIAGDTNGYDEYFGVEKTDFGRGTLIIRHTDYQNKPQEPIIYTDYLSALVAGADTTVEVFEEGDYEVALDYEVSRDRVNLFGWTPIHSYTNYRIFFRFSVRNGNCMIFPFDVKTNTELTNSSMTENGFFLDLAKSRYLDIHIKKEMLADGADGLIADTRFNSLAKDGDRYTDEGIYTITVKNRYTGEQTEKKIYVGTDHVLRAFVSTGLPISEIKDRLARGAYITEDGSIVFPQSTESEVTPTPEPTSTIEPVQVVPNKDISGQNDPVVQTETDTGIMGHLQNTTTKIIIGFMTIALLVFIIVKQQKIRRQKALKAAKLEAIELTGEGHGRE